MTSEINIQKIKEVLPHGSQKKIAEKAGVSRAHVNSFLKGRVFSLKVLDAAIEVLEEYKQQEASLIRRFEAVA